MSGFNVKLEGIDLGQEQVQALVRKYKKVKKYQKSNLFAVKTMDGTENYVSKLIEEGQDFNTLD